ncbi:MULTISPECIES: ImmA/IrrE family metallo-endopeptidase [unclassified Streptomyces]|uniref:ImmA/IrrE family metallo-endopeptidase n=1 Tax=unclassified Streptomyces TaxID=2593676 RepID=UPI000B860D3C|nr:MULTISPECIES: ImmA/IrrE family metallo-endopeptidase [unclassified Streptomyces]MYZ33926.1 ImmA/IrrE family metallo-endopeptidase [Streptomyces sp. SID4917]
MHTFIIKKLRALMPTRPLELHEARSIAERQATLLLELLGQRGPTVDVSLIADLPRIEVKVEPNLNLGGISGFSQWSRGRWLIVVNRDENERRRRFTLSHEFKHVLDHPFINEIYKGLGANDEERHRMTEQICDYFAACLLMPRNWLKRAWASGIQSPAALAAMFNVSEVAMKIRLRHLRLIDSPTRAVSLSSLARPVRSYFRRGPAIQSDFYPTIV